VSMTIAGLMFGAVAALSWAVPVSLLSTTLIFAIGALANRSGASPPRASTSG
jgi:Na+-translocating ferredoxin:NAD+ oxidoreductase RnfD subunit